MALIEPLLIAWLRADLGLDARTETPAQLETRIPLVQLARISGGDDTFRLDYPVVDVDAFAADRLSAATLAENVRASLMRLQWHGVFQQAVVTDVVARIRPRWLPYDNAAVRRYGATYAFAVHDA
jgi:hypothetical protein